MVERQVSNQKTADSWFDYQTGNLTLGLWKSLCLFPIVVYSLLSGLLVTVAQLDKNRTQKRVLCVGVVTQTQSA